MSKASEWRRLPGYIPENPKFAGAYFRERVYGGSEEGGWWYNISEHLASVMVMAGQDPLVVAEALWEQFSHMDDGRELSSVLSNGGVFIEWEDKPKEHHDTNPQHYE